MVLAQGIVGLAGQAQILVNDGDMGSPDRLGRIVAIEQR